MAASSVISVKVCLWTVCGCKYIANKLYRSKTILIGRTFSMFNIIKIPRKYLRELLHDSNVAFHCKKSLTAILGGKLFGEVFYRPSTAPVGATTDLGATDRRWSATGDSGKCGPLSLHNSAKGLDLWSPNVTSWIRACVFTAMHGMQTRSSDENCVCLSVRLSVCRTREL